MKTEVFDDKRFRAWEMKVFGCGYGTGEEHTLSALKVFLTAVPEEGTYDFQKLEAAVTPTVAWLLISTLCHANIIEYGTSPRFGWLTPKGHALRAYVEARSVEQMYDVLMDDEDVDARDDA
jgi:hypothetical protein